MNDEDRFVTVRKTDQLSLADGIARRGCRSDTFLSKVASLIDWAAVEAALAPLARSRLGAPGYPVMLMLKVLLLQQWYALSDPAIEDALSDRLSLRRFVGLALDAAVPDHSTISRFRTSLVELDLTGPVFDEVLRQIEARGLLLREGTMIDATLVEAAVKRPKPPKLDDAAEPAPVAAAGAARAPSKLVNSKVDPDARWAKKGGKRTFGYKGHVGVDRRSGIIRKRLLTDAAVADTTAGDALVCGDEAAVYADAAYDTHARRAGLKARRAKDRIAHRPNKHHRLTLWQQRRNQGIGRRRSGVERVFATAKRLMGWCRARYIGLARNAGHFDLICTAMNVRRLATLAR